MPNLRIVLEHHQDSLTLDGKFHVTVRIVYDATEDSRPVVIHYLGLRSMCSEVLWRRAGRKVWTDYVYNGCDGGYALNWDDPDKEIHIVGDNCFDFLRPGQSIDVTYDLDPHDDSSLPPGLELGDEIRYQYKGGTIDWWDWGTEEDHKDTKVTVKGIVYTWLAKPNDNDGRPRIEVHASNVVQFRIV